ALLGTTADDPSLEGELGPPGISSGVQAVCAISGPFELRPEFLSEVAHAESARKIVQMFIGGTLEEKRDALLAASPAAYVTKDDPPFFIIHGERDELVPVNQSRRMHTALEQAGVTSQLHIDPTAGHVIHMRTVGNMIVDFFEQTLMTPANIP